MKPENNNTSTASLSPPSNNSSAGITKSTSLPISRSSNSAWEKPERARTSHACEPCRERKTKCDGSRPACRRCLHTGTSCYYGYGKGWRKRKTAEDLTATSRRLARYEHLLNEILPMVSSEVRTLIEDARDLEQDGAGSNNGSETTENEQPNLHPQHLVRGESAMSGSSGRIILPLPVPSMGAGTSPLGPTASRSSTSSGTFESIAAPSITNASTGPNVQSTQRHSPDSGPPGRLPSITAHGLLIETGAGDPSPTTSHRPVDGAGNYQDRPGVLPISPNSHTTHGENTRPQQFSHG